MTDLANIIQVHSADEGGGAETVVGLHHRELSRIGYRSHLLVGRQTTKQPDVTQIPFLRGPRGLLRLTRWLERTTGLQNLYSPAFRKIEESFPFRPDILHFHSLHGVESFAELSVVKALSRRLPTVITMHDLWLMTGHCGHPLECQRWKTGCGNCPDLNLYPPISRDATSWNFRRKQTTFADCRLRLIVPSQWLKAQVQASPILSHFPVTVVYNPVDIKTFCPGDRTATRARYGVAESDRVVLMVAQHLTNPYKGIELGIECLNACTTKTLKVILVGNAARSVSERVKAPCLVLPFTNNATDLAGYYRMADVLLMPSRGETFGLVAAEAMACGTAVVAAKVGGLTDVIGENEGGVLADRTTEDMASAIDCLMSDDGLRRQKASAGRRRCEELFSPQTHTEHCLRVYCDAISEF